MNLRSYTAFILLMSCVAPAIIEASSSVVEATSVAQLQSIISSNARVVVDFYSPTCPPCKRMAPHYAQLPSRINDVLFVKIDVALPGVTSTFGIRSMPTLYCYLDGVKISQSSGFQPINDLVNYVTTAFTNATPPAA